MNILFLACFCIEPSVGGVQRVTDTLTKELQKRGHSVFFLSVQWKPFIPNYTTSAPQFYVDVEHDYLWKDYIKKIITENQIEYVINQMPGDLTNSVLEVLPPNVKIVSVFHTQPFLNDRISRKQICQSRTYNFKQKIFKIVSFVFPRVRACLFGKYESRNIRKAILISDRVCFISNRFFARILKHIPDFPKQKLVAINNPNTYVAPRVKAKKDNIVLWVGRVENGLKNTIDFVKIWERLFLLNPDWKAIVAGDGEDLLQIRNYVKKRNIKNVDIIGRCDNVELLYQKSKIVVVTSFTESWSMVLTEGMTYGCVPCAYDTYETVHDIISDASGFLSDASPSKMAIKIQKLMSEDDLRNKMSNKAVEEVNKFSAEKIVDQWVELLHSIV